MQPSDGGDGADYSDREAVEVGRILVLGAAVGVPLVFVVTLLLIFAAGARGAGTLFVAAWAALIGGTFIGSGILLAKRLSDLGVPEHSVRARVPRLRARRPPRLPRRPQAAGRRQLESGPTPSGGSVDFGELAPPPASPELMQGDSLPG